MKPRGSRMVRYDENRNTICRHTDYAVQSKPAPTPNEDFKMRLLIMTQNVLPNFDNTGEGVVWRHKRLTANTNNTAISGIH